MIPKIEIDYKKYINQFIASQLPTINAKVQEAIVNSGKDPWAKVAEGNVVKKKALLSVNTHYEVLDMKHLSTTTIDHLEIDPNKDLEHVSDLTIKCPIVFDGQVKENLTADTALTVTISTSIGSTTFPTITEATEVLNSAFNGNGFGLFTATVIKENYIPKGVKLCLTKFEIENFNLDFEDIKIDVDLPSKLEKYRKDIDAAVSEIAAQLKEEKLPEMAEEVKTELNESLGKELREHPICQEINLY